MKIWIIGKFVKECEEGIIWEFQGACDDEELAIKACEGHNYYFIAPANINEIAPDEKTKWDGCYYPFYSDASKR